ncbi:MAG: TIM barrel protein [Nitrospirota bacterium]
MRRIGVHTSIAGGLHLSLERAHALGCNTLQIFSHNPRGWDVKILSDREASRFRSLRAERDISPVFIHASYLVNLASRDGALRRKSVGMLVTEMERADKIGADYVILHTGICWDTCHAFAAGYDIRETVVADMISSEMEKYIGLDSLKLIHLNDSKGEAGAGVDRHEHIGLGNIGISALSRFINRRAFRNIPLILETPKKNEADDLINLAKVRKMTISQ